MMARPGAKRSTGPAAGPQPLRIWGVGPGDRRNAAIPVASFTGDGACDQDGVAADVAGRGRLEAGCPAAPPDQASIPPSSRMWAPVR